VDVCDVSDVQPQCTWFFHWTHEGRVEVSNLVVDIVCVGDVQPQHTVLVTELMENGDLYSAIAQDKVTWRFR
jgi:hypothetical protein